MTFPSQDDSFEHGESQNLTDEANEKARKKASSSKTSRNSFPFTLHYMLNEVERDGYAHIISWQPHGRALIVHNPKELARLLLPSWFRQSKYTSFQRQLNVYGFRRLTSGHDKGSYYHAQFIRGRPDLCHHIQRTTKVSTDRHMPSSSLPKREYNFYLLPYMLYCKSAPVGATEITPSRFDHSSCQSQRPSFQLENATMTGGPHKNERENCHPSFVSMFRNNLPLTRHEAVVLEESYSSRPPMTFNMSSQNHNPIRCYESILLALSPHMSSTRSMW